jgi:hypothetical protein
LIVKLGHFYNLVQSENTQDWCSIIVDMITLDGGFQVEFVNPDDEDDCSVLVYGSQGETLLVPLTSEDPTPLQITWKNNSYLVYYQNGTLRIVDQHLTEVSSKNVPPTSTQSQIGDYIQFEDESLLHLSELLS